MITKRDLTSLRKRLPANSAFAIAKITGFSVSWVYRVLKGEKRNQTIIDAAIDYARKYQEQKQKWYGHRNTDKYTRTRVGNLEHRTSDNRCVQCKKDCG